MRLPHPMPPEWKAGLTPSSRQRPHGVVVVRAVDAVGVHPERPARRAGEFVDDRLRRPLDVRRAHHRLETQLSHRVVERGDRLIGRVHRDRRHREPVAEPVERLGEEPVERAARGATLAVVGEVHEHEADARVHDREVEAELGQLVEQLGGERGGEVPRARGRAPPRRAGTRRRIRSSGVSVPVGVGPNEPGTSLRSPGLAGSSPSSRRYHASAGKYSMMCPSPSTTGCGRRARISADDSRPLTTTTRRRTAPRARRCWRRPCRT